MNLSQRKGKEYERHIARRLQVILGEPFVRTGAQEKWKSRGGDVNPRSGGSMANRFFWEAKKRESWSVLEWYKKAADDSSGTSRKPVVVCSRNNEDDYVFLSLDDFGKLLAELKGYEVP